MKLKLRTKLLIYTQLTITLIFGAFILYNGIKQERIAKTNAIKLNESYGHRYALLCKNYLDIDISFTKSLGNSLEKITEFPSNMIDTIYGKMMLKMLENNQKYISVWSSIELRYLDSTYQENYGRKSLVTLRKESENELTEIFKDMDGDNPAGAYFLMKSSKEPSIMEPYIDPDVGDFLITSVTTPVIIDNEFAGLGGVDIQLTVFQEFIDKMDKVVDGLNAMVVSNSGMVVAHTNTTLVGKQIDEFMPELNEEYNIVQNIQNRSEVSFEYNLQNTSYFSTIIPFLVEGTNTPWAFSITIPLDKILSDARATNRKTLWLGMLGIALFFIVIWFLANYIVTPLTLANKSFKELAKGNISEKQKLTINTGDELQELGTSVNNLIDGLRNTVSFAKEIEEGNFQADYKLLGNRDRLGLALLKMRDGLSDLKEKELERQSEDQHRNWRANGLATFSDLLRKPTSTINELMQELVNELIDYSSASQGAIYIINDSKSDDIFIEQVASIAYDSETLETTRIELGEGLIGTCIKENKKVFLDDLPENYLKISSGLGEHKPLSLIIIPLVHNNKTIGALELASIQIMEDYQLELFEDLSESIASAINNIQLNIKTNELLETTQEQAETLQAQEEELRQNLEEMMATQEESSRRIKELEQKLKIKNSKK